MVFAKHDFTENFFNAIGYKDTAMEQNIIIDEIARLLVDDKKNIVEALRKAGINVSYKDSPEVVKAYLVKEIEDGNVNILNFLAKKISLSHIDEGRVKDFVKKFHSADATTQEKTTIGQILSGIVSSPVVQEYASETIANAIKKTFEKDNTAKVSNETQLSERLKANQMLQAQTQKKRNTALVVIGVLVVLGGIGLTAYYISRKNKYADGGLITPGPGQTTPPAPLQTTVVSTPINQ